jgi:hypothetical protein
MTYNDISFGFVVSQEMMPYSMRLVLEWFTRLLASLIALLLLHKSKILLNLQPKTLKVNLIQSSCAQQAPAAAYSALAVDRAT